MPRVLIAPVYLQTPQGRHVDILKGAGFDVRFPSPGANLSDPQVLLEELSGVDATLASIEPYPRTVLERSTLRVIARNGVGYDAIDVAAATARGILVTNTPGANKEAVAEHAIALMLAVAHGFPKRDRLVRSGRWERKPMRRLAGQTLGLVGLGAIGREVALRALALGVRVVASDPAPPEEFLRQYAVELVSFEELLGRADMVSLHLPCNAQTNGFFDAGVFAKMKAGAVFINTARGALVDEDALVAALRSGRLAGAGLDVFQQEPLPANHPLLEIDTALLCPHMAGLDEQSLEAMARLAAESIVESYRGRPPGERVVNREIAGSWKW
ncbi:MAG: phosphoglycerate dehydrogenase [Thermoguttaceae bacterium]|jgi:D-3-phosphoglycerate dehydrogenase